MCHRQTDCEHICPPSDSPCETLANSFSTSPHSFASAPSLMHKLTCQQQEVFKRTPAYATQEQEHFDQMTQSFSQS